MQLCHMYACGTCNTSHCRTLDPRNHFFPQTTLRPGLDHSGYTMLASDEKCTRCVVQLACCICKLGGHTEGNLTAQRLQVYHRGKVLMEGERRAGLCPGSPHGDHRRKMKIFLCYLQRCLYCCVLCVIVCVCGFVCVCLCVYVCMCFCRHRFVYECVCVRL